MTFESFVSRLYTARLALEKMSAVASTAPAKGHSYSVGSTKGTKISIIVPDNAPFGQTIKALTDLGITVYFDGQ